MWVHMEWLSRQEQLMHLLSHVMERGCDSSGPGFLEGRLKLGPPPMPHETQTSLLKLLAQVPVPISTAFMRLRVALAQPSRVDSADVIICK